MAFFFFSLLLTNENLSTEKWGWKTSVSPWLAIIEEVKEKGENKTGPSGIIDAVL